MWQTIVEPLFIIPARMLLTAYCFVQFAIQVLWLSKIQMPRIFRADLDASTARERALYAAHRHVVHYLNTLSFLRLVKFRFEGEPHPSPCIVVANHPSLLDFIVLLKDFPNAICLFKSQSLKNPVLSAFVQIAGYIEGMDGTTSANKRITGSCCERLSEGHHVVFFPEGTRSETATDIKRFRKNAFYAAVQCDVEIQPVAIVCEPLFLGKDQGWLEFCRRQNHMTISYLPAIKASEFGVEKKMAIELSDMATQRISERLVAAPESSR